MNTICRLCLGKNVEMLHVSESKGIPGWTAAIAINELLRIEISDGDIYPKFICTECMGKLVDFKRFKHQCEINKDSLDLEYRRNREVGGIEDVVGIVFCTNDKYSELYFKEEEAEVPMERDPLDFSGDESPIESEIEESSNGNDGIPSAEVIGSADQIHHPIKCELDDQVISVDANETIIPDTTSTTEAVQLKEEYPEINSPSGNTVYCDGSMKEELKDITSESCSNASFEEVTPRELTGCPSRSSISSDVHTVGPRNDDGGFTSVSSLSRVEDITGNQDEVPKSNPMSSHAHMGLSSCDVPRDIESEPIMLSQCRDEHSTVSRFQNEEKDFEEVFIEVKCYKESGTSILCLRSRKSAHSTENPLEEAECSDTTRRQGVRKTPMKINSEEVRFRCPHCSRMFFHKKRLEEHLFRYGNKPFACKQCCITFDCKDKFEVHMENHSSKKPLYCALCSDVFHCKEKLRIHMIKHSEGKLFDCKHCGKSFTQKGTLKVHMRIHSGEKAFKCDVCSKSFSRRDHLKVHMRFHTGERPYQCDMCRMSFSTNSDLKRHIRVHSGERPYKCVECSKSFSQMGSLKVHMKIHSSRRLLNFY